MIAKIIVNFVTSLNKIDDEKKLKITYKVKNLDKKDKIQNEK